MQLVQSLGAIPDSQVTGSSCTPMPRPTLIHHCILGASLDFILLDLRIYASFLKGHQNVLVAEEQAQRDRYRTQAKRDQFALGRLSLRFILGQVLNIEPGLIEFSYSAYGKPYLRDTALRTHIKFNLAHSGEWMLIALCHDHEIGIDLETKNGPVDALASSEAVLSPEEHKIFIHLDSSEQFAFFYQLWVAKEALVKGVGCGLHFPLSLIDLSALQLKIPSHIMIPALSPSLWTLLTFKLFSGFYAAVAIES